MSNIVLQHADITITASHQTVVAALLGRLASSQPYPPAVTQNQTAQPPAVGKFWPGEGGVYAGLMRGENGQPDWHLIVPTDPAAFIDEITWGGDGHPEPDATNERDGHANTMALTTSNQEHSAAEWAASLSIDGHSDLYLPARRELRLCWVNVPELFAEGWYWSSTQYSPGNAWGQGFADGDQYRGRKGYEQRARAVRRVLAI